MRRVVQHVPDQGGMSMGRVALGYLTLTVIAYWVQQGETASIQAILYAGVCFAALAIGWLGVQRRGVVNVDAGPVALPRWVVAVPMLAIWVSAFNIAAFYADWATVWTYLGDPGGAYERVKFMRRQGEAYTLGEGGLLSVVGVTVTALGWTRMASITILVACWAQITRAARLLFIAAVVCFAVEALLIGAMINVAMGVMAAIPAFLVRRPTGRTTGAGVVGGGIFGVIGLGLAGFFLGSRANIAHNSVTDQVLAGWSGLVFYATNGYQGLALSLQLPFTFSWGHGMFHGLSPWLEGTVAPPGGILLTYPERSEAMFGWSATQLWSTAFAWVASDLTFLVVPFVMLLFGVWVGTVTHDALVNHRVWALVLLGHLLMAVVLLPANNYLFHTVGNTAATVVVSLLHIRSTGGAVEGVRSTNSRHRASS
jgi:hypothetical protein